MYTNTFTHKQAGHRANATQSLPAPNTHVHTNAVRRAYTYMIPEINPNQGLLGLQGILFVIALLGL